MRKSTDPRFFNRELSWIEFNARVLQEGLRSGIPVLERLKFLSIVSSNFDEFFMVRVAALQQRVKSGKSSSCPTGMSPAQQLKRISLRVRQVIESQHLCLAEDILPRLKKKGLGLVRSSHYNSEQLDFTSKLFKRELFPVLTPVRVQDDRPFPGTGNLRTLVAFLLRKSSGSAEELLAIVQIPQMIDRFIWLPGSEKASAFTLVEDVITSHAPRLFPGYTIQEHLLFRVTLDAHLEVDEELDQDFMGAMEQALVDRQHSRPVRLEICGESAKLEKILGQKLELDPQDIYHYPGPLDLKKFMDICFTPGFDSLRFEPWEPNPSPSVGRDESIWATLERRDVLLHHPYESFELVSRLLSEAAVDPDVLTIKMTLYRTSGKSAVIEALATAAENGKQVTVLVEVKARFDEERNIGWAQRLEQLGVIVIYGIAGLKIHAKALLIVRREPEGIRRYAHLGTGNYNDTTAKLYTDMGLLTSSDELTYEISLFFNAVTGYSAAPDLRKLAMAPISLKERLISLIVREAERSTPENPGLIMAKLNSLAEPDVIEALYRASCAGVTIRLNVRGICMLVPGAPGLSENIEVVSIVGRFLEHSRICYFRNRGNDEIYLSSADWMPRNLQRRVELLFPVEQADLKERLKNDLQLFFQDNTQAHVLQMDGTYRKKVPLASEKPFQCQRFFYQEAQKRARTGPLSPRREFNVRRRAPG